MATRTIIIKPAYVAEMIEIFGEMYMADIMGPYVEGQPITMIPNPETKTAFAGRMFDEEIKRHIQQIVMAYRRRKQEESLINVPILE